ncbi:hypothetical protein EV127DRAFT_510147 [Xylaria flabelliformis]|nr:hypothetical protein EV127DRAFT_510147 [Xylaria flabelliformis]
MAAPLWLGTALFSRNQRLLVALKYGHWFGQQVKVDKHTPIRSWTIIYRAPMFEIDAYHTSPELVPMLTDVLTTALMSPPRITSCQF